MEKDRAGPILKESSWKSINPPPGYTSTIRGRRHMSWREILQSREQRKGGRRVRGEEADRLDSIHGEARIGPAGMKNARWWHSRINQSGVKINCKTLASRVVDRPVSHPLFAGCFSSFGTLPERTIVLCCSPMLASRASLSTSVYVYPCTCVSERTRAYTRGTP